MCIVEQSNMVDQLESAGSVAGYPRPEMTRRDSAASTWKALPVSLSYSHGESRKDIERYVQLAWLLLLSTYDGTVQPTCWFRKRGETVCTKLLFASIDRSMALRDHEFQTRELSTNDPESRGNASTVIAKGPLIEALDWVTSGDAEVRSEIVDFVLVLDDDENSVHLLFKQGQHGVQDDDVTGRIETLKTILSVILESSTIVLGDADFLSDYDKRRIIEWNRPMPDPPLDLTIPSAFATIARASPNASAIFAWDGGMTYDELDIASSGIASLLNPTENREPGAMILFIMRKSKWALVAALAILKSGKAIVPLDPDWPKARIDQIIDLTGARMAVCDEKTKDLLEPDRVSATIVPSPAVSPANKRSFEDSCTSKDLAFVLFSSGSTGVPKGMLREHGTACTGSYAHARAMHLDSTSRVLQFANHVFDVAMLDFFTTLLMGGCVCIPSDLDRKNDVAGFVNRSQANWALLTPTVAELLDPCTVPSFRFVTLGGECIKPATLEKWLKVCRVGINYGSAEVDVTHVRDVFDASNPSNVGLRLPSCLAYIVDSENAANVLPVGAVGELVIAGSTMAREYLNAPEKTAQVFISTPQRWFTRGFVEESSALVSRLYRMGDLCRQRHDGSFDFVGRKDFQVKVNSQKVELGDIESRLCQHAAVKHCIVLYPLQGPYSRRLVAVVQSHGECSHRTRHDRAAKEAVSVLSFRSMTDFLSRKLPSFMLPSVLIRLKTMPYTPTMKIDRNRLKVWLMEDDVGGESAGAGPGEICHISTALNGSALFAEELTAMRLSCIVADVVADRASGIWASVHGHDNRLVDIGIDSAQMMQLASKIHQEFGAKVLVEVLADPDMTVRKLAALLGTTTSGSGDQDVHTRIKERVHFLKEQVAHVSQAVLGIGGSDRKISIPRSTKRHVLLTGATGYLGLAILQHLLTSDQVASVVVLVRADGPVQAGERVRHALAAAGCPPDDQEKLRAWPGDLSRARLGLDEEQWHELTSEEERIGHDGANVDTIIHCGAVVDWSKSYEQLRAANVGSTEQLIKVTRESPRIQCFIFISGGRYPDPSQDHDRDLEALYAETAESTGYAQSKFVAERVVENVRRVSSKKSIHIVSPAYLIGSGRTGAANQDDYLWRMVWAAVRARAYNSDEDHHWLFVAETDSVARRIVTLGSQDSADRMGMHLNILDGLGVLEFWKIVTDVSKVSLAPESADIWIQKVRCDIEDTPDHLLWPLANALALNNGHLTKCSCLTADMELEHASRHVSTAVRRNLEYLSSVGFFGRSLKLSP